MLDTSISNINDLPEHVRCYPSQGYLKSHIAYWHHAVDVAYQLLAAHKENHGHREYGHVQFMAHFKAALKQDDIDREAALLGPFELKKGLNNDQVINDPQWIAYREALKALSTGPRGMAMVFKIYDCDSEHWEALVHLGGGTVVHCRNLHRTRKAATREQIWDDKFRKLRFVVGEIYENGRVQLNEGKMRGSSKVFSATTDAVCLTAEHIAPVEPRNQPISSPDALTLALF